MSHDRESHRSVTSVAVKQYDALQYSTDPLTNRSSPPSSHMKHYERMRNRYLHVSHRFVHTTAAIIYELIKSLTAWKIFGAARLHTRCEDKSSVIMHRPTCVILVGNSVVHRPQHTGMSDSSRWGEAQATNYRAQSTRCQTHYMDYDE